MKKTLIAAAGAALLGLASFSAPAAAMPVYGKTSIHSGVHSVRYVHRHFCKVKRVVKRDRFGRRIVRHVRVCR
jgi:hypothetical protein